MKNPTSISLGSLAVLMICVLVGTLFSNREQSREETQASLSPLRSPKNEQYKSVTPLSPTAPQTAWNTKKRSSNNLLAQSSATRQNLTLINATDNRAHQYSTKQEQFLRKRLLLDEAALTREVLPDGTELIHLNGSQSHFSAASFNADGSVEVQCHSSYEALQNQGSQPVNEASAPTSIK